MWLLQVSQWLLLARCHWAICFILSTVARCHNRSMEHRPGPGKMRGLAGTWLSISPWLAQVLPNPRPVFRSRDQYCPIRDKYKLGTRQSPGPGSTAAVQTHWAYSSLATLALWDYFTRGRVMRPRAEEFSDYCISGLWAAPPQILHTCR